jgi:hypothetical protein
MKKLVYLIVLITALSLIIAGCGIPVVPPTEQNEPGTLPNKSPDLIVPDDYTTIQAAISAASPGETIFVRAGTYVEQIIIDKSITLQGASKETTIIEYPPEPASDQYLVFVKANNVTIREFKLFGHFATDNMAEYIVHSQGTGLIVENNEIQGFIGVFGNLINGQIKYNIIGTSRKGIYIPGGSNVLNLLIEGNTIKPAEGAGPDPYAYNCGAIYMDHATGVIIQGNTMQDFSSSTDSSMTHGRGVEGSHNSNITIFDNTFVNNRDAITMWIVNNITISENLINNSDRFGINIKGQDILIENNDIQNNGHSGINVAEYVIETKNVAIHHNNFIGNKNFGVVINKGGDVGDVIADATCNWWGAVSGPSGSGLGSGDAVSENVIYSPWLLGHAPDTVCYNYYEDGFEEIAACAVNAKNHGKFVSCVAHLTNDWLKDELITDEDKDAIMSWAFESDIGKK